MRVPGTPIVTIWLVVIERSSGVNVERAPTRWNTIAPSGVAAIPLARTIPAGRAEAMARTVASVTDPPAQLHVSNGTPWPCSRPVPLAERGSLSMSTRGSMTAPVAAIVGTPGA